jgi:hypothetical protein
MKKKTLNTSVLLLCLITPVTPFLYSKILVVISYIFLMLLIFNYKNISLFLNTKLLILFFFLPGFILSALDFTEVFFRFMIIFFLFFSFPFKKFKINFIIINLFVIFILYYLIFSQFLIVLNNEFVINFRDNFYPYKFAAFFENNQQFELKELIFENNRNYRQGGLFYNPNDFATIIFIYFLIYDRISEKFKSFNLNTNLLLSKIFYFLNLTLVLSSLLLTYSRTVLFTMLIYLIIKSYNDIKIINLFNTNKTIIKMKKKLIIFLPIPFLVLFSISEQLLSKGIFNQSGSLSIKYKIFLDYLYKSDFIDLLVGGNFNVFFDQEYGYWLGSAGILGLIGFVIFFRLLIKYHSSFKSLIISFLFLSIGATVFYNFMIISILIPLIIINTSLYSSDN